MSVIMKLPSILEDGKKEYEHFKNNSNVIFKLDEMLSEQNAVEDNIGTIAHGDNLNFISNNLEKESIDLVYIDPPFFSKSDYGQEIKLVIDGNSKMEAIKLKAYKDTWKNGIEEYLRMLVPRFFMIKDVLSEKGSLWVHLDWHSSHYVKIILDEIFGEKNFLNEIIWNYKSGGSSKNCFSRKHDTLLFYKKTNKHYFKPLTEKSYNRGMKPYRFKGVKEYVDHIGWYTIVNMKDVWQIDMVGRTSSERTGYATQKPEALLTRIIDSCTQEGDVCADFFGGSGTLAATAQKMNRRWITCDKGDLSILNMKKRFLNDGVSFKVYKEKNHINQGEITVSLKSNFTEGEKKTEVVLISFKFNDNISLPIEEKDTPLIEKLIKNDSLQLIDFWSIDTSYNGRVFKPKVCFMKEKSTIQNYYEINNIENGTGEIAIKIVDIFGGNSLISMALEECKSEKNK